jgi:hypothetical protein
MTRSRLALALTVSAVSLVVVAQSLAHASGRTTSDVRVVTFTEVLGPHSNHDVDLGAPGLSVGDEQVFNQALRRNGVRVGHSFGVATVVRASKKGLTAQVVSTASLRRGTFTLQVLYKESFASGPPSSLTGAVTGGTGVFRGVTGQCHSSVIAGTENNRVTCRLHQ